MPDAIMMIGVVGLAGKANGVLFSYLMKAITSDPILLLFNIPEVWPVIFLPVAVRYSSTPITRLSLSSMGEEAILYRLGLLKDIKLAKYAEFIFTDGNSSNVPAIFFLSCFQAS